uniref:NADH-ubiquinone oxidoreductase chain 5 n=1 Tax=Paracarsidara gigantea TaxID=2218136 RepID=A0A344A2L5_9HEMI|nr:NADH dehydrogenase subunit 5 [Paracarsidara gigantea]AWU49006.1 NADH dehydrogenase subunit 5 [Paracarsidara gigantea]
MKFFSKFYFVSFFMIIMSLIFFFMSFLFLFLLNSILLELELFSFNSINFNFIIYFDWMSMIFSFVVTFISSLVLIYSKSYIGKDCYRFLWMTLLFIMFMIFMILSPSVLGVILGWDGLGIISYCLVIYYQSKSSFNSGFITAASNRLGDSLLMLAIVWYSFIGNFMFWEVSEGVYFMIFACMTSSAQFPFSAWLPAAMAAPTPISSLVHSSTLVTAGVYLMIRYNFVIFYMNCMSFMTIISGITIFLAGLSAIQEFDLKRVIALSTLGQLGFMIMILSLGYSYVAFFHLVIHAMFKSLLFLCAGAIIHGGGSIQDLRKMGSMNMDVIVKICFYVSNFCLMGIPFSSGFYSKDTLLELSYCSYPGLGLGLFMFLMAFVTMIYTFRLMLFLTFNNFWVLWMEVQLSMSMCLIFLMLMNIISGSMFNWLFMNNLDFICLNFFIKMLPIVMMLISFMLLNYLDLKNYLYLIELLFISSLTKSISLMMNYMLMVMKLMDQGWLENFMLMMKSSVLMKTSWIKNILSGGSYMYMYSIGIILLMLMF